MASARTRRPTLPIALLLLAAVSACGGGETVSDPATRPLEWGRGSFFKRWIPVYPPIARHVRADRQREKAFVVNLTTQRFFSSRRIHVHDHEYTLTDGTPEEREGMFEKLRGALERACSDPDARSVEGTCRLSLRLNADVLIPWSYVEDVLRGALGPSVRVARVQWSVRSPDTRHGAHQEAAMVRAPPPADALTIEIHGRRLDDGEFDVRLSVGDWSRTVRDNFGTHGFEIERRQADALDAWRAATPVIQAQAERGEGVELRVSGGPEGVAWRHVVRVLDLLLGAGVRAVDLPSLDVRLVLAEPEDTSGSPFLYPDDPVAPSVVIVLSGFAVLAAFVLTFLPLLGGRSKRKRPPRT